MKKKSKRKKIDRNPVIKIPFLPAWVDLNLCLYLQLKKRSSKRKELWLRRLYFIIFIVIFLQILRLPIGGKTFMSPDQIGSNAFGPMNDASYDKGQIPQWNPYIFGGMPWVITKPDLFVAMAIMMHLPEAPWRLAIFCVPAIFLWMGCLMLKDTDLED